ncbi:MAG: heme exporter protein CcmB [Bacteroidota bacterium]
MTALGSVPALIKKEFLLEWRQKYALGGIMLYVFSTIFVVYLSFVEIGPRAWNALFWIIILFASVNAITKSFIQENSTRQIYYYSLASPLAVIFSKIIYNQFLLLILSGIAFAFFALVAGNPVKDTGLFLLTTFLGSTGFSITFTFISAIAAKANNSATLMAIMSFPVIFPILMTLIKLTAGSLFLIQDSEYWRDIVILLSIDIILITLVYLLFPYLWRD